MNNVMVKLNKHEELLSKLGQSQQLVNEVLSEFVNEIKGQVKEEIVTIKSEIESNIKVGLEGTIKKEVGKQIEDKIIERGLSKKECNLLRKIRNKRFCELLGNSTGDRYILFISFLQSDFQKAYRKKFEVYSYAETDPTRFEEACEFTRNYTLSGNYINWAIERLHENYKFDTFPIKSKHILKPAYERYFEINAFPTYPY